MKEATDTTSHLPNEIDFTVKDAAILTEKFLQNCKEEFSSPIYLIFDEIENISRETAPADHWCRGIDFALFWQSLRSIFQRTNNLVSYLVVGTNPSCIELPKIDNIDNPIFNHFNPLYIPGFEVKDTREMVRKLGKRMGLRFDESIYAKLTEDYGGHPFLMRHVCSLISKEVSEQERPVDIGKISYANGKSEFIKKHSNYLEMIISVLKEFYSDEYKMLTMLANDNVDEFSRLAKSHPSYTSHLVGYGIIKEERCGYVFNIESVRDYILEESKFTRIGLSKEEMWAEISVTAHIPLATAESR